MASLLSRLRFANKTLMSVYYVLIYLQGICYVISKPYYVLITFAMVLYLSIKNDSGYVITYQISLHYVINNCVANSFDEVNSIE